MAAKLGSTDVSFRLGATTPAKVYLGSEEVWTAVTPRTLYFVDADDNDWANLNNWFDDPAEGIFASSLPTAADSVVITGYVGTNSGDAASVANLESAADTGTIDISVTVSGLATLGSPLNGTIIGSATFIGSAYLTGTVTGTATFTDSACNLGGTAGTFVPDPPPSCS